MGKYKGVIVSVALFILLDASVLILNFYMSFEIAEDAVGVNLAGRQRMLSQRMMKSLLDSRYSIEDATEFTRSRNELELTRNLFDSTLSAFYKGGTIKSADASLVTLKAVDSPNSIAAIEKAYKIWTPYKASIDTVLTNSKLSTPGTGIGSSQFRRELDSTINFGQANNLKLLKLMNDLTVDQEIVARSKAETLRWIQTAGITLAVINFFIIMFHFVAQLRRSDAIVDAAREETSNILTTVNEGLFLLDSDKMLSSQHSDELLNIFEKDKIAGLTLDKLLGDIITEKEMKTTNSFVRLLFENKVKEKLIGDLNPLSLIEVHLIDRKGNYVSKFLKFDFSKVVSTTDKQHVLVTVTDVTRQTLLAKELEQEKSKNEDQLQILSSIIHTNNSVLNKFITNAYQTFDKVNNQLRKPEITQGAYVSKIDSIFNEIHRFKGDAGALELDQFATLAHELEDDLSDLKEKRCARGAGFYSSNRQT